MKTILYTLAASFALLTLFTACDDDENFNPDSTPSFAATTEAISTAPGETVVFTSDLSDEAGIAAINLKYEPWFLDKTIRFDSIVNDYALRYSFRVPDDAAAGSTHPIEVVVTSKGGKMVNQTITVTLDADVTNPEIFINTPFDGETITIGDGPEVRFNIEVTDANLSTVTIATPFYNETIDVSGTSATITREVEVETPGFYDATFTVTDLAGNATSTTISLNIVDQLAFPVMFLTSLSSAAELEQYLFGNPFPTVGSTEAGEEGKVFTGRFYAETGNEELRFIPQKGGFGPFAFGADAGAMNVLQIGASAEVPGIKLTEGPGYYEVTMNLSELSYNVTKYEPNADAFPGFYIVGQGPQVGNTDVCTRNDNGMAQCFNFASGKLFDQDPNNPNRWSKIVTLADGNGTNQFIFTATDQGWSPFWRLNANNVAEVNSIVPNGGVELAYQEIHYGTYLITADTHLNTITALRQ